MSSTAGVTECYSISFFSHFSSFFYYYYDYSLPYLGRSADRLELLVRRLASHNNKLFVSFFPLCCMAETATTAAISSGRVEDAQVFHVYRPKKQFGWFININLEFLYSVCVFVFVVAGLLTNFIVMTWHGPLLASANRIVITNVGTTRENSIDSSIPARQAR